MTTLSDLQQRAIVAGFRDMYRRLADMEAELAQAAHASPFQDRVNDLSPTEIKVLQDYFARLRSTMAACLREHDIPLEQRRTSLRWVLQTAATLLQICVSELGPRTLRGYGTLDDAARQDVIKVQQELARLVDRVGAYLRQQPGRDLPQRLAELDASPATTAALTLLNTVILRWQLVEFRPTLDTIVRRLAAPQYEIAVFGRVNSGKSSLLNHIAGRPVLPVGVTPVTAVPTRLVRGDSSLARVHFAELEPRTIELRDLPLYASEKGNPGNQRHVTMIEVRLPAPRLREGVVLVDTPGIGSLATTGSAETFAYLPRCDLGVVLVDAASTLNQEDLTLLGALQEAGIPAHVLLSKADLLSPADRQQTLAYVQEHIQRELAASLPVHAVSSVGPEAALLTTWFEQEIEPLLGRHRKLTEASLARKTVQLRESVAAVLETMLARRQGEGRPSSRGGDAATARRILDDADAAILDAENRCREWTERNAAIVEIIVQDTAGQLVRPTTDPAGATGEAVPWVVDRVLGQAAQMAWQVVEELKQKLEQALCTLHEAAPLASTDIQTVRDFVCRGLPRVELPPPLAQARVSAPWWTGLIRPLALRTTQERIQNEWGAAILRLVQVHNAQLRAWLNDALRQLVERYQSQAEVLREQLRRLATPAGPEDSEPKIEELRHDLEQLQAARGSGT